MPYFDKFPTIEYNGRECKNITTRAALTARSTAELSTYQSYSIPEGVKPSEIAFDYYGKPSYDWMLFFSNKITDPYYDWCLDSNALDDLIISKYGSTLIAKQNVKHFRVNYKKDNTIIDRSVYNDLSSYKKHYWTSNSVSDGVVINYKRKPLDYILSSNKTIEMTLTSTAGLVENERITQYNGFVIRGTAQISKIVSTTTVIVDRVVGFFNNTEPVTSNQTNITTTLGSQRTLYVNIGETAPNDVSLYWEPVTYYEYEEELNEQKREIYAIDRGMLDSIETTMTNLLQNE